MTPKGWQTAEGHALFELGGGHAPRDIRFDGQGELLYLKVDDFNDPRNTNGLCVSKHRFSLDDQVGRVQLYEPGTIVFPKRGAAIFKNRVKMLDKPATVDSNLMCLSANNIEARFLCQYLIFLGLHHISDNSGVPQINNKHLYPLLFPVPPLPEQKKIAAILGSVDEAIAATQAVIDQTRKVKQGLLQQLLTRGIGHTRFKKTEIGEIPAEWDCVSLGQLLDAGDLVDIQDGNHGEKHPKASDYVAHGIPFVMARDLCAGTVDTAKCSFIRREQAENLRVGFSREGDVLLTHKGTVGEVAITPGGYDFMMLTPQVTYYRVAERARLSNYFLLHAFSSPRFQTEMAAQASQSTRSYIGISAQKRLQIPLPPRKEQSCINEAICNVDKSLGRHLDTLQTTCATRSGMMQDLLTGRVRVKGAA